MAKSLGERIASARSTGRVTITDLETLIDEVTAERDRQTAIAAQANNDALNYALSADDRDEAATRAERAKREADAMEAGIADLSAKLAAKRTSESRLAKEAEKAEIIAERDALAQRIKAEWPALEAQFVDLLHAIKANDARLAGVGEISAEAVARGCPGNFCREGGIISIRRLSSTKLPSFDYKAMDGLAWPVATAHPLSRSGDEYREAIISAREEREADNARYARYIVYPRSDRQNVLVEHRRGFDALRHEVRVFQMTAEQVADAKKSGCNVEPVADDVTLGSPLSNPVM